MSATDTNMTIGHEPQTRDLLVDAARRLLDDLCTPALLRALDRVHRPQGQDAGLGQAAPLWAALCEAGLDQACAAPAEGGSGLGWRDVAGLVALCGRYGAPVPLAETLAAHALARLAGCALPAGGASLGVAIAPDGAGGDDAAVGRGEVRIVADGVAFAGAVRRVLVSLPEAGGAVHRLLVLPVDAAGAQTAVNPAGELRTRLTWEGVRPEAIGVLPAGVSVLLAGAAVRSAQIAGACAAVVDMATRYAGDRVQFGRAIGKFQAIQHQLAIGGEWASMAAMGAQLALSDAGVHLDAERVASAKQVAGTAVERCAAAAHAVHGAIGVTAEYDLQLHTRRMQAWAREFGSSLYWGRVLGDALLAADSPRSWEHVIAVSTP